LEVRGAGNGNAAAVGGLSWLFALRSSSELRPKLPLNANEKSLTRLMVGMVRLPVKES
jgi:hypothetical protein